MIEQLIEIPSFLEERTRFFKRSYQALEQTKLMAYVSLDADDASYFLDQVKAIAHIRFSLWMDLHGVPSK